MLRRDVERRPWVLIAVLVAMVAVAGLTYAGRGGGTVPTVSPVATVAASTGGEPATPSALSSPALSASPESTPPGGAGRTLPELLAMLPVRPEDRLGYERSRFRLWIDADHDGCNTRQEVLIAEAIEPARVGIGCRLGGGRWQSPYDGIQTTNPSAFDIDHVVPLAEAWDSGASAWTPARRTAYANDLDVPWTLIAVSASSNRSKGDRDVADWLPPAIDVRCVYVADWLAIKVRWSLAVDANEAAALASIAGLCPDTMSVVLAP